MRRSVRVDGGKLVALYRERGMTAAGLAEAAGVHVRTLRSALSGNPVDEHTAACLASALSSCAYASQATLADIVVGETNDSVCGGGSLPAAPVLMGRRDCQAAIADVLLSPRDTGIVGLRGPRGIGKSALAIDAAHSLLSGKHVQFAAWFSAGKAALTPYGIVPARQSLSSLDDLDRAVRSLLGDARGEGNAPDASGVLPNGKPRGLVVLDDLAELAPRELGALLLWTQHLPSGTGVIATCRCALAMPGVRVVSVPPLQREDALQLLNREARNKGVEFSPASKERIVEVVGGIPGALEWVVGRMSVTGHTAKRVIAELLRLNSDPHEWYLGHAWRELSVLHRRALLAVARNGGSADAATVGAEVASADPDVLANIIGELGASGMLTVSTLGSGRLSMLPLTRALVLSRASEDPAGCCAERSASAGAGGADGGMPHGC